MSILFRSKNSGALRHMWPFFLSLFLCTGIWASDISFVAVDAHTDQIVCIHGDQHDIPTSPHSTFKIALSLMGYDLGILLDEDTPAWPYENYEVAFDSQKGSQTPKTWIPLSVVWYSQLLTERIGMELIQHYLSLFDYGNQDMTGDAGKNNGLSRAWLGSSLRISPLEQITFLKKLTCDQLPVSAHALNMTKRLLLCETLESGWKLFGKTGTGKSCDETKVAWYVGWIEKEEQTYLFALLMRNVGNFPSKAERQTLTKQFLRESLLLR